jgi:hypothetical protein
MTTLPPTCSDEEVVEFALKHYFLPEELTEARRMMETGRSYEEAVAYLADRGLSTLRDSGGPPPHIFLTIPGGLMFVYHPQHPFPHRPVLECSVGQFASHVLPRPETPIQSVAKTTGNRYQQFSLFEKVPDQTGERVEKGKQPSNRPKKLRYAIAPVRIGTKQLWRERPGIVVKDGYLGYVVEQIKPDFYSVNLVHLNSNRIMATVYLSALDETTHARIQGWVADALQLTDWSRGITAILKEKTGEKKQYAWSKQIEALWKKHRTRRYQFSLFDTSESQ